MCCQVFWKILKTEIVCLQIALLFRLFGDHLQWSPIGLGERTAITPCQFKSNFLSEPLHWQYLKLEIHWSTFYQLCCYIQTERNVRSVQFHCKVNVHWVLGVVVWRQHVFRHCGTMFSEFKHPSLGEEDALRQAIRNSALVVTCWCWNFIFLLFVSRQ